MKRFISLIVMVLVLICFSVAPAQADRKTMEGVMIGLGVAMLGSSIMHNTHQNRYSNQYHIPPPQIYHHRGMYNHHQTNGYWGTQRVWIEPREEMVWNPTHYNQNGILIEGHWSRFEISPGYYQENRVWIRTR